jgi:hypothetical protein
MINTEGTAGKFNIIPLMLTIGTGFGLMSLSVLIADFVTSHFSQKKDIFKKVKNMNLYDSKDDSLLIVRI